MVLLVLSIGLLSCALGWIWAVVLKKDLVFLIRHSLFWICHGNMAWREGRAVFVLGLHCILLGLASWVRLLLSMCLLVLVIRLDLRSSIDLIGVHKASSVVSCTPRDSSVLWAFLRVYLVGLELLWLGVLSCFIILICDCVISVRIYWCVLRILIHLLNLFLAHRIYWSGQPVPGIHLLLVEGRNLAWVLTDVMVQLWHFLYRPKPWRGLISGGLPVMIASGLDWSQRVIGCLVAIQRLLARVWFVVVVAQRSHRLFDWVLAVSKLRYLVLIFVRQVIIVLVLPFPEVFLALPFAPVLVDDAHLSGVALVLVKIPWAVSVESGPLSSLVWN